MDTSLLNAVHTAVARMYPKVGFSQIGFARVTIALWYD